MPGLPVTFTLRPAIDPTLCVHAVDLSSAAHSADVDAALRGQQPGGSLGGVQRYAGEVAEYGGPVLALLPCDAAVESGSGSGDSEFTTEVVLGGFYYAPATLINYRQVLGRANRQPPTAAYPKQGAKAALPWGRRNAAWKGRGR